MVVKKIRVMVRVMVRMAKWSTDPAGGGVGGGLLERLPVEPGGLLHVPHLHQVGEPHPGGGVHSVALCTVLCTAPHSTPSHHTTPHHPGVPGVGLGEPDERLELPGVGGHLAPPRAHLGRYKVQGGQVGQVQV